MNNVLFGNAFLFSCLLSNSKLFTEPIRTHSHWRGSLLCSSSWEPSYSAVDYFWKIANFLIHFKFVLQVAIVVWFVSETSRNNCGWKCKLVTVRLFCIRSNQNMYMSSFWTGCANCNGRHADRRRVSLWLLLPACFASDEAYVFLLQCSDCAENCPRFVYTASSLHTLLNALCMCCNLMRMRTDLALCTSVRTSENCAAIFRPLV